MIAACAALAAAAFPAAAVAHRAPAYEVVDLGALTPDVNCSPGALIRGDSRATALTDGGLVAGVHHYECDHSNQGFLITPTGRDSSTWSYQALPRRTEQWGFGWNAEALDVNASGMVVGRSNNQQNSGSRPVAWANGALVELGWLGLPAGVDAVNVHLGVASGISDDGTIVGTSITPTLEYHPFRSDVASMVDLGVPPGHVRADAVAIGEEGSIALNALDDEGRSAAFRLRGRRTVALGDLGGGSAEATDVSDSGKTLVGSSTMAGGAQHAFAWKRRAMRDLGPGRALGVNDAGDVVGAEGERDPGSAAFLVRKGRRYDLTSLVAGGGWTILEARAINDRGQIAATGDRPGGLFLQQALLLNPVR